MRLTILDFHFTIQQAQGQPISGNGGTFFSLVTHRGNTGLDFAAGGTGNGIGNGVTFTIAATNFVPRDGRIRAQATVPEPGTLTLLGMGALGLLGYSRRRKAG